MFVNLIKSIFDLQLAQRPSIDVFIELSENDVVDRLNKGWKKHKDENLLEWADTLSREYENDNQMEEVRSLLIGCIDKTNRHCPFKVHWSDPTYMVNIPSRISTQLKKYLDAIDKGTNLHVATEDFDKEDTAISNNYVIKKEIDKAELVDEKFNMKLQKKE